jgi:curli biogenesis system outer membrane secretion channel CsgG
MLALEKPHWGISGVPFMNKTTGADSTALSMACLVSCDRKRVCRVANRDERRGLWRGRNAVRKTCRTACKYANRLYEHATYR